MVPKERPESPAAVFIAHPYVCDHHEIEIAAPADLVFFDATRLNLQTLPFVRAIFRIRAWLMRDTFEPPVKPLGIVAETMVLGWGLLAHTQCRSIVMGAAARPWTRNVTFRTIPSHKFAAFDEPDYVKIVWTLEADPIGPERTRFRTETRVEPTDKAARRKFFWYWIAFGVGIRFIRWSMLRELRRHAMRHHREWAHTTAREARLTSSRSKGKGQRSKAKAKGKNQCSGVKVEGDIGAAVSNSETNCDCDRRRTGPLRLL